MVRNPMQSLLTAPGAGIEPLGPLDLYGQLIGSWRVESTWYGADGSARSASGEWHFARILGGRGVQDVLFADGASPDHYGTSVRCYDPGIDAWRVAWMHPAGGEFVNLVGRRVGDRIVQQGPGRVRGQVTRWSFAEIERRSFVWLGEVSEDDGASWFLEQKMTATRIDAVDIAVIPAADDDYEFCYQVKKAAEGDLIAAVFGWDEAFQRDYHQREWAARRPSLIVADGRPVGTIELREQDDCLHVAQFFIAPESQGLGIGSRVLGEALHAADEKGLPCRLALLAGNRCVSLYRRNAFEVVGAEGALCYMERRPSRPSSADPDCLQERSRA